MADTTPDTDRHLDDDAVLAVALGNGTSQDRSHLRDCCRCAAVAAQWSTIRSAAVVADAAMTRKVAQSVLHGALARVDTRIEVRVDTAAGTAAAVPVATAAGPVVPRALPAEASRVARRRSRALDRLRWALQLLLAQIPILRRNLLAGAVLLFVIGAMVVLAARVGNAPQVLASLAPVVAVFGLAMVHGPEVDPAMEITCATGTSARVVLLARLVLVTGFDLAIALCATVLATLVSADAPIRVMVVAWFGPLLLLAAVSLAVSVLSRPAIGMGTAIGLWVVRLSVQPHPVLTLPASLRPLTERIDAASTLLCSTNLPTLGIAVVLVACTVMVAPRQLRLSAS